MTQGVGVCTEYFCSYAETPIGKSAMSHQVRHNREEQKGPGGPPPHRYQDQNHSFPWVDKYHPHRNKLVFSGYCAQQLRPPSSRTPPHHTNFCPKATTDHGKILGTAVALLILRAASVPLDTPFPTTFLHCNNHGVISHSNSSLTVLLKKQQQANLIRLIKYLGGSNRCRTLWEWVEGHSVERKGRRHSSLPERLNDQGDKLTKRALVHAIAIRHVMRGDFPFEVVKFKLLGQQMCGSPRQALEAGWRCRDIIRREDFHLVWWEGLGTAMAQYRKMYWVWLTKHVSGFCGNNVQQYYWSKGSHSSKCKFCSIEDEYSTHTYCCEDPGRDSMFRILVSKVHTWLVATLRENTIASTVEEYLLGRGWVT